MVDLFGQKIDTTTITAANNLNGWQENMSDEVYHATKTAVGSSSLKMMIKSPHAFAAAMWGKPKEPTKAMRFGTLAHLAMLQGQLFRSRYVVQPEFESYDQKGNRSESKNTTYYKNKVAEWKASLPPDAIIVTEEERENLFCMIESVLSHPDASALIKGSKTEIAGFWQDEQTGINCKLKPDILSFDASILPDLKTTQDVSWESFRRSVESLRYDIQMAMYAEGVRRLTGRVPENQVWICVESKYPFETRVYELNDAYKKIGQHDFRYALNKIKECIAAKNFPQGQQVATMAEPSIWFERQYKPVLGDLYRLAI